MLRFISDFNKLILNEKKGFINPYENMGRGIRTDPHTVFIICKKSEPT